MRTNVRAREILNPRRLINIVTHIPESVASMSVTMRNYADDVHRHVSHFEGLIIEGLKRKGNEQVFRPEVFKMAFACRFFFSPKA